VDNAPHHPGGDFGIDAEGLASRSAQPKFTWASIGLFRAALFDDIAVGTKMALRPKLELAIDQRRLRALKYDGHWTDVGTMERLASLHAGG
jgi:N-acetyl-alpha-D-muramate 1-phosphate uridylyltransferase